MADSTTQIIYDQLRLLGWHVTVHRVDGQRVEIHAVLLRDPDQIHIARCNSGDGLDDEYGAACMLAEACGIELADG
jgi:hypothetical protein